MKNKLYIGELLFYTGFVFFLASKMLVRVNEISLLLVIFRYIAIALSFMTILLSTKKISMKTLRMLLILIILIAVSDILTNDSSLSYFALFAIAARKINFERMIRVDLISKTILLCVVVILFFMGLTSASNIISETRGIRYSLGFSHPNQLAVYLFGIYLDIFYLIQKTNFLKKFLLTAVFYATIAILTDSRSSELSIIIAFILSIIPFEKIAGKKALTVIVASSFWIFLFMLLILTLNISHPIVQNLNKVLSGRISLQSAFLQTYGIKPFGNLFINYRTEVEMNSSNYILDSAYMQLLIRFGFIITFLFGFLYSRKIKECIKCDEKNKAIGLISFLSFGTMETGMYYIHQNPFLLALLTVEKPLLKIKDKS